MFCVAKETLLYKHKFDKLRIGNSRFIDYSEAAEEMYVDSIAE